MTKLALPCIRCGKELRNVDETATNQPYEGTAFQSPGHYGSTIYDPMDGRFIEINLCDECLRMYQERVLEGREAKPVRFRGSIVGWCKTPGRMLVPWNPDLGSFDEEDALDIDEEVLEHPERYPEIAKWNVDPKLLLQDDQVS
jgi:hypothetical protein